MNNTTLLLKESFFTSDRIIRTVAYGIVLILGLVGNVFVLVALKRKPRKKANDLLILNLTASDLVFIVCLTSDIYMEVANFPYTTFFCRALRPLSTLLYFSSIFTITAMAIERYQVITKPFQPKMGRKFVLLVIAVIWLLAVIFVVPLPIVTTAGSIECVETWPGVSLGEIYTFLLLVLQYLLPLAIISVAYIRIAIYLCRERGSQQALHIQNNAGLRAARRENIQVVKAFVTVVIFFAACMLPNQLAWLFYYGQASHQKAAETLLKFSPITSYLHSCANPMIYGTFMMYFRREFKVILSKSSSCFRARCCYGCETTNCFKLRVSRTTPEDHSVARNSNIRDIPAQLLDQSPAGIGKNDNTGGARMNLAFVKQESMEKEPDFQDTRL